MILREWRGRAVANNAAAYPQHFRDNVISELSDIPGFIGATLSSRVLGDGIEFLVLTRWESMDAIRAFAPDAVDRAVVEPGAVAALVDFDAAVSHYEVIESI